MDFSIIINEWTVYWQGLYTTLFLVAISLLLGLLIAVPLGILRNSDNWLFKGPAWAYIYFFRGTPLLIQLFLIYYGAGQWVWLRESAAWELFSQAWFCAILA
ncbi:MAG: ABC transporter permease subunit, partial [Gammaproteobacteria bacterium]|nr:ABC transporter permease subunit [Gammaproteobacteria bacterium]